MAEAPPQDGHYRHGRRAWTLVGAADLTIKLAAAVGVLTAGFMWLIEPRIKPFTDVIETVSEVTKTLDRVSDQMVGMMERIVRLENRGQADISPPFTFAKTGNAIADGEPGSVIVMRWNFDKQRDCGAPIVDAYLEVPVRGATQQAVTMRFRDVGIADTNGRGIVHGLGPGSIAFPVRVPDAVPVGDAEGWVTHSYPDCPLVLPVISPRVPFTILTRMAHPGDARSDWGELRPEGADRG